MANQNRSSYMKSYKPIFLIDDSKARTIAEAININCIGTLGLLLKAKEKNLINELKPIFKKFLSNGRFFSKKLLNEILARTGEAEIK